MLGSLLMMALVASPCSSYTPAHQRKTAGNLQYAGAGNQPASVPPSLAPAGAPAFGAPAQPNIPAGFDTEGFVRQAKLNFIKLQAVHDSGKLGELREFTTDAMFESIKQESARARAPSGNRRRGDAQCRVAGSAHRRRHPLGQRAFLWHDPRKRHCATRGVREIWNLAKPVSGATGWVLAGIQQVQ